MQNTPLHLKLENIKKLIRRDAKGPIYKVLNKLHPADIAYIIQNLNDIDRKRVWSYLHDKSRIAEVILELDEADIIEYFSEADPKLAGEVLTEMESDDASYVVRLLPESVKETVTQFITERELSDVEELLHYPEKTAGAMMNTEYLALPDTMTVKEATKVIHKAAEVEMIYYLYVIDSENRLSGVLSLRQLIVNPPEKLLKEIMSTEVIFVTDSADREDVANIVAKYDFMALPVVDEQRQLVGIITFDDVIDVIQDEATADMYKMAGTTELLSTEDSVIKSAKARLPWLLITLVGEMFSGVVIAFYQDKITEFLILSSFMPVIMAMGGNVGSQSATIIIRSMALGRVDPSVMRPVLLREVRVGLLMGFVSAILVSIFAPFVHGDARTGIVVGTALFCAMSFAAFTGAFVPMTLTKFKIDPAVASGPFISTFNDLTGLTIYFSVAIVMLSFL